VGLRRKKVILHPFRNSELTINRNKLPLSGPGIKTPSSDWFEANFLDPEINGATYQFLRGIELVKADFGMESINAFDCIQRISKKFLINRNLIKDLADWKKEWAKELDLEESLPLFEELVHIRNYFSAHHGGSRFWDFEEMFGEYPQVFAKISLRILRKLVEIEKSKRLVEPNPPKWSEWFWANFKMLLNSVWRNP